MALLPDGQRVALALLLLGLLQCPHALQQGQQQQQQQPQEEEPPQEDKYPSPPPAVTAPAQRLEREYQNLYLATEDKASLEAIKELHRQLDDDNDGTIEPNETGDFIRGDLHYGSDRRRRDRFHHKDSEITVKDLWVTWKRSEVFNWTTEQVAEWVTHNVELPQYAPLFKKVGLNGTQLPRLAASPHFLSRVVGITSPIHRSKITLKAMDIVLFGPPRDHNNFWKDLIFTSLLLLAVIGLFYAYRQNKTSKGQLQKMMADLDSLAKAENELQELQEKLQQKDSKIESLSSTPSDVPDAMEISRLKEELDILRSELHRAEVELEDKCWVAPPVLQHWLQLTYELESVVYNAKKKAAEEQLEMAKDMSEKLKRKRSSLVGAFVSTHGRSYDDVDRSILEARTALLDLTKDLTERSQRWRQIEMLCGVSIVTNPGLSMLQGLVRHVGAGRGLHSRGLGSRLSRSVSQEDLMDEMDSHSVAASHLTVASSHMSKQPAASTVSTAGFGVNLSGQLRRRNVAETKMAASRDSSKESSSSDDLANGSSDHVAASTVINPHPVTSSVHQQLARASTPPVNKSSPLVAKRSRMMKSFSQDAGGSIHTAVASAGAAVIEGDPEEAVPAATQSGPKTMTQSASEGHLQKTHHHQPTHHSPSVGSNLSSLGTRGGNSVSSGLSFSGSKPSVVEEELEELSCSASESGSLADLDAKKKKKRSFFNFRKKKEKKDVM